MKFPWQKKEGSGEDGPIEISIPDDQIAKAVQTSVKTEISAALDERLKGLSDIQAFVADAKKEKDAAAAAAAAKHSKEQLESQDEELEQLLLTDPRKAIGMATEGQQKVILQLRADNIKRDVFEDAQRFEYYTGEFKSEVDKLIAQQPLAAQNDPTVVENCYFSLLGKKQKEIKENTLKSRFAGTSGSLGAGKTGEGAGGTGDALEINDDIRKAAKIYGTTPEAYAKMVQEAGVGYV